MVTREKVIAEIKKVPEQHLDELYRIIKEYEVSSEDNGSDESVMARLRQIKISALPDFSTRANLHELEDQNVE